MRIPTPEQYRCLGYVGRGLSPDDRCLRRGWNDGYCWQHRRLVQQKERLADMTERLLKAEADGRVVLLPREQAELLVSMFRLLAGPGSEATIRKRLIGLAPVYENIQAQLGRE